MNEILFIFLSQIFFSHRHTHIWYMQNKFISFKSLLFLDLLKRRKQKKMFFFLFKSINFMSAWFLSWKRAHSQKPNNTQININRRRNLAHKRYHKNYFIVCYAMKFVFWSFGTTMATTNGMRVKMIITRGVCIKCVNDVRGVWERERVQIYVFTKWTGRLIGSEWVSKRVSERERKENARTLICAKGI